MHSPDILCVLSVFLNEKHTFRQTFLLKLKTLFFFLIALAKLNPDILFFSFIGKFKQLLFAVG